MIQSVGRYADGRGIADCDLGSGNVVVDRLGNADQWHVRLITKPRQNGQAAVPADSNQAVDLQLPEAFDDIRRTIDEPAIRHRKGKGDSLVGRSKNSACPTQQISLEAGPVETSCLHRARG